MSVDYFTSSENLELCMACHIYMYIYIYRHMYGHPFYLTFFSGMCSGPCAQKRLSSGAQARSCPSRLFHWSWQLAVRSGSFYADSDHVAPGERRKKKEGRTFLETLTWQVGKSNTHLRMLQKLLVCMNHLRSFHWVCHIELVVLPPGLDDVPSAPEMLQRP